ncbi:PTS glucitol/sorbitol transporter subunit IIA [Bacillus weihaiensis]|uniref:PTS glucitol/sorbitol transporter subunit IIA n=1 Tax=Bacillus weihaiensis TaxID=1547283 RepID=UPI00235386AD|nr:PTS glucitol/sorbitol transporter subunit IIA [Bacillus weihaiensis]
MEGTMINKYQSKITEIGADVKTFLSEGMMIIFNSTAPADLKTIAVVHEIAELQQDVVAGDYLEINGEKYEILFVGDKVNETLKDLGHCTIMFNGETTADLPGTMTVEKKTLPTLKIDSELKFVHQ